MERPEPSANTSPPTSSAPDTVEARLGRIEDSLAQIQQSVNHPPKPPSAPKSSTADSKFILAGAFGLVGMKLGGLIFSKIGILVDSGIATKKYGRGAIKEISQAAVSIFSGNKESYKMLRYTIGGGIAGSIIGAVGGALLGWHRGNRLDSPGELLSHPVDSLKKIFGPATKPKGTASSEPETPPKTPTTSHSVEHQGTLAPAEREHQRG